VRQGLDPAVDDAEVDGHRARARVRRPAEPHAELRRAVDQRHHLGGGDEGLGGDDVGEHGRPADTVGVHDRDVGPELRRDQRRLVPARSPTDDDDA